MERVSIPTPFIYSLFTYIFHSHYFVEMWIVGLGNCVTLRFHGLNSFVAYYQMGSRK